jgi:ribonucleotide monophosphatase NagD (HAD superfamily)
MEIPVSETKAFEHVVVPNNFYSGVVKEIRTGEGAYGTFMAITFEITEGEFAGKKVDALCNLLLNKKSKLFKWLTDLKAEIPVVGQNFNTDSIIGKTAKILVKTGTRKDREGVEYKQSYVDDIEAL